MRNDRRHHFVLFIACSLFLISHTRGRVALPLILLCIFAGGCAIDDLSANLDDTPFARLRGASVNYDVLEFWSPAPIVDPSHYLFHPERPPLPPPKLPRMTIWWQTLDEVIHHEDVEMMETVPDAEKFAGLLWVEVTPRGGIPKRLTKSGNIERAS
jgi:hypothetical protein